MENNNALKPNEIIQKRDLLTQASILLKKEFFGIDSVIDQIIESISSWYFFPHLQERPVVVNLWGMTGVGKSDLLERLIQLLNLNDQYFHFDMSEIADGKTNMGEEFSTTYQAINSNPVVFTFDEFQLSRSVNEEFKENSQSKTRIVWDIIDSGKYKFIDYNYQIGYLHEFLIKARFLIKSGLKVKNGVVVRNENLFIEEFNVENDSISKYKRNFLKRRILNRKPRSLHNISNNKDLLYFIDDDMLDLIFDLYSDKVQRLPELKELVVQFNEIETIEFVKKVIKHALIPKTIDLSKSLIFVVGNLDEAYKMSGDFNPDIDADSFYEETRKIGISDIKTALKYRFRKEQISRLGNTHIIYPSLDRNAFQRIIMRELNKIEKQCYNEFGRTLTFDRSVVDMLYAESVFPTQGARPVLSTINQLIRSKLGNLLVEITEKTIKGQYTIDWSFENSAYVIRFIHHDSVIHKFNLSVDLKLKEKRKAKKDDVQSIVAVHESGHAVVSCILLDIIPDKIVSTTASDDTLGFNYTGSKTKIFVKDEMVNRVALFLGGIVAEELVFGSEKITSGSGEDISKATEFASRMIKSSGMFKNPIDVQVEHIQTNHSYFDFKCEYNQQLEKLIEQGKQKANTILNENIELLIHMANYLSDNTVLYKPQINEMVERLAKSNLPVNSFSYRSLLKSKFKKVKSLGHLEENRIFVEHISLNKNSETV